jgi:hypothetical protein
MKRDKVRFDLDDFESANDEYLMLEEQKLRAKAAYSKKKINYKEEKLEKKEKRWK